MARQVQVGECSVNNPSEVSTRWLIRKCMCACRLTYEAIVVNDTVGNDLALQEGLHRHDPSACCESHACLYAARTLAAGSVVAFDLR